MSAPNNIDIIALAAAARRRGYDGPDRIIERLERIIARNIEYINRPYRQGRAFNEVIEEDAQALAAAIVLIESLALNAVIDHDEDQHHIENQGEQ